MRCETLKADPEGVSLVLVEEINHRVANEYSEAIAILALASRAAEEPARSACRKAADRLRSHAAAHRALMAPLCRDAINAADYLGTICRTSADASLADRGIRLILRAEPVFLAPSRCWRMGLIIAELVRNAARHGLARGQGAIMVQLSERSGEVDCLVCDTGQSDGRGSPGRGQRLCSTLASELGGAIGWIFGADGGIAHLQFPAKPRSECVTVLPATTPDLED